MSQTAKIKGSNPEESEEPSTVSSLNRKMDKLDKTTQKMCVCVCALYVY